MLKKLQGASDVRFFAHKLGDKTVAFLAWIGLGADGKRYAFRSGT